MEKGSPSSAFLPPGVCRYLKVQTPGKMGVRKVSALPDTTPIKVVMIPGKSTCSLVLEVTGDDQLEDVDYGTIIVGGNTKNKESDPEPSTKEMVWTAHPGYPTPAPFTDKWKGGETITAADVKKELGNDFYVSVKVVQ
jgi:hypothetical protein